MTLAIIGVLTCVTAVNAMWWRAIEVRSIRWKLYQLRDRLRWEAISDRSLLQSELFWTLDFSLTTDCAELEEYSLWSTLPFLLSKDARDFGRVMREKLERELGRPENEKMATLYKESCDLFVRYLLLRHVVLIFMLSLTILGGYYSWRAMKRISKAIVFGEVIPGMKRRPHRHAIDGLVGAA